MCAFPLKSRVTVCVDGGGTCSQHKFMLSSELSFTAACLHGVASVVPLGKICMSMYRNKNVAPLTGFLWNVFPTSPDGIHKGHFTTTEDEPPTPLLSRLLL
ncbi:rCG44108 [Rattus norvegicus]|uniref:RCG44108 n=1 Tax=Rattus norvegicus TaxID=10116 RepID=A6J7G0_RAT|nr:rCG44108 [Rattus norvegicus]